jgi:hypothetical protein
MIPSINALQNFTIHHRFTPVCPPRALRALPRRTSPVLSPQELRQIVLQIVG